MKPASEDPAAFQRDVLLREGEPDAPPRRRRPFRFWLILFVIAGVVGWLVWPRPKAQGQGEHGRRGGGEGGPVPVVVAPVEKKDFPLYVNGLGTVQAYNSVTVRARVDGELQQVLFQEGQTVQKGDVLAQIDPRTYQAQLDQAKAKLAQDQAQLSNARSVLARNEQLFKGRVIDQQTYDAQRYSADQLQALVQADQAAIDNAQTELDYTRIVAPITGRVGIRLMDAGNIIRAADSGGIVVINQVQPISVVFTLPQQELGGVREALLQNKTLEVQAYDRDNQSVLSQGTLEVLDNQIDPTTATVKLKAVFANTDYRLWPGQFVNVRLLLGQQTGAVVVPSSAIQRGPDGAFVYTIGPDQKAVMLPVTVGATEDGWTLVTKGLEAGGQVVVDGQYRLQPGSAVSIKTPAPSQS